MQCTLCAAKTSITARTGLSIWGAALARYSCLSTMSAVASDITEDDTPSNLNHSETVKDPLRNNISPVVTDIISNAINVISLLEAFSGMIPAPPFVATIFTLVKVIVKLVQVSMLALE